MAEIQFPRLTERRCAQGKLQRTWPLQQHLLLTRVYHQTHRRDQLIEWIKGLLAVPFVLNSQPAAVYDDDHLDTSLAIMAKSVHDRYADIFRDVEALIIDHISHQSLSHPYARSKLSMLVPTISTFFTPLSLVSSFKHHDHNRAISSRRFVPPSFNDIRLILNSSQVIPLTTPTPTLKLITFDGDLTLYEDGGALTTPTGIPIITRLLHFLSLDVHIGIVTAAGYSLEEGASKYYARLSGLLDAISTSTTLTPTQKESLIIMGGESNYLYTFSQSSAPYYLKYIHRRDWILPTMLTWSEPAIQSLLSAAESAFHACVSNLKLSATVLRKQRAVGIYPTPPHKITREQLEETVLVVQQIVEMEPEVIKGGIPFTTFNGGSDVFLDIGDKSLGVQACQKWFGGINPEHTLHVGDQFLSGGGNDFKARSACTTAWIASPEETVNLLDEIISRMGGGGHDVRKSS